MRLTLNKNDVISALQDRFIGLLNDLGVRVSPQTIPDGIEVVISDTPASQAPPQADVMVSKKDYELLCGVKKLWSEWQTAEIEPPEEYIADTLRALLTEEP